MLTFRNMLIMILAGSMIIIAAGWIFGWLGNWLVLGLVSLNLGMIITGSFFVCSGLYIKVYCAASTNEKVLALTFDDGPRPEHTPAVLDLLAKYGIKAAFFVVGNNIKGNESILKRTSEDGHLIGNHSFVHANNFGFFGVSRVINDLKMNQAEIEAVTGLKTNLFRPPFGVTNPNIARAVNSLNYTVIGWNIRSLDTVRKNTAGTVKIVKRKLRPGSIILLHDNHERIIPTLTGVIEAALEKGYTFVRPDEMLNLKAYK